MKHIIEVKKQVLKLINEGYSIAEIERQTGVTVKTVRGWRNKWREADKDKIEATDRIWNELKALTKKPLENAPKIRTLSASFGDLKKELLINSKYYDL